LWWRWKRNAFTLTKLEKFNKNQEFSKVLRVTYNEFKNSLERDMGKTTSNLTIPPNQIDEIRMTDLKWYSWIDIMI